MVSPESSSTMRTVPCIAGCDGPMLRSIGSLGQLELAFVELVIDAVPSQLVSASSRDRRDAYVWRPKRHALVVRRTAGASRAVAASASAVRDERLRLVGRVVLAQRMPHELRVHQDAAQIGVAVEDDAEHVERLALEPVGAGPHADERVDLGAVAVLVADARLEAHAVACCERVEVQHDLEARLAVGVVDAAEVDEHVHVAARIVAQEARDLAPARRLDDRRVVAELRVRLEDRRAELRLEELEDACWLMRSRSLRLAGASCTSWRSSRRDRCAA